MLFATIEDKRQKTKANIVIISNLLDVLHESNF